jgi:hypothetical protein
MEGEDFQIRNHNCFKNLKMHSSYKRTHTLKNIILLHETETNYFLNIKMLFYGKVVTVLAEVQELITPIKAFFQFLQKVQLKIKQAEG